MFISPDQSQPIRMPPPFEQREREFPGDVFVFVRQNGFRLTWGGGIYQPDNTSHFDASYLLVGDGDSTHMPDVVRTTIHLDEVPLVLVLNMHLTMLRPWVPGQDLSDRFKENGEASYELKPEPTTVVVDGTPLDGLTVSAYDMHAVGVQLGDRYLTAAVPAEVLPKLQFEFQTYSPEMFDS